MSGDTEFLLTSSQSSQQWSACLWNFNSESGNILRQYKNGGVVSSNTLTTIGNDFILAAEQKKPLLHVWPINSQDQVKNIKLILPDPADVLAVSPDNCYLAVGIREQLYVWQLCSGKLLSVQKNHLSHITCVKFSGNADYLITACQNGTLVTYNFGDLICLDNNQLAQTEIGQVEPMYSRKDHSRAITNVYVGSFGLKSRFATVSSDHTCQLHDLLTGQLIAKIVYDEPLSSVIFDASCWHLFLGTNSGVIQQFNLQNPPRTLSVHTEGETNSKLNFLGHTSRVTCLDLNITNDTLVSGSDDSFVLIWSIYSRQMLNKIEHKGAVNNVRFILRNENLFAETFKPRYVIKTLERSFNLNPNTFLVSVINKTKLIFDDDEDKLHTSVAKERITDLEEEILKLLCINKELYDTST